MKARINKSLDYNNLLNEQANGKLLKKRISFPLYASIKYDGNYVVVIKEAQGMVRYITSGGHEYTHRDNTFFDRSDVPRGVYIAERIGGEGKLGDRVKCNLSGPRGKQESIGHSYKIHDFLDIEEYDSGIAFHSYIDRKRKLDYICDGHAVYDKLIMNKEDLAVYLEDVTSRGYEGLMLKSPDWYWKDTKSRTVDCVKYKKRPTADLEVIGVTEGEGKYVGMIGALLLIDSQGREVSVGSGLSNKDRAIDSSYWVGRVVEIEYEQILHTYIQPTFIRIREDKDATEIN